MEAGLGGRLDATNVLRTKVVLLTNVALEHTDVLGGTVEEIAQEKLAVAPSNSIVVLPDYQFVPMLPHQQIVIGGAHEAAEAFVGHPLERIAAVELPGRLEQRVGEIRDGAHNPDGVRYLVEQLRRADPRRDFTIVVSILADKDAEQMLGELRRVGSRLVATRSSSERALPADAVAELARAHFDHVEAVASPLQALARAHVLGEPVLVTGSLYLLGDLVQEERERERRATWRK